MTIKLILLPLSLGICFAGSLDAMRADRSSVIHRSRQAVRIQQEIGKLKNKRNVQLLFTACGLAGFGVAARYENNSAQLAGLSVAAVSGIDAIATQFEIQNQQKQLELHED